MGPISPRADLRICPFAGTLVCTHTDVLARVQRCSRGLRQNLQARLRLCESTAVVGGGDDTVVGLVC